MIEERLVPEQSCDEEVIRQHIARYEFASELVVGKTVLDVACGSGYGSVMFGEKGAKRVLGVDISEEAVHQARMRPKKPNVEFVVQNAESLSFPEQFNLVVSFETIEHLPHPELFLKITSQFLSVGGTFVVSTPIRDGGTLADRPQNPFHEREWTLIEFKELLSQYFREISLYAQYNFEKKWFPYSRTLQRQIALLIARRRYFEIKQYAVLGQPPILPGFRFAPIYAVALCRVPLGV